MPTRPTLDTWDVSDGITAARLNDIHDYLEWLSNVPAVMLGFSSSPTVQNDQSPAEVLSWGVEDHDNDGMHSSGARITFNTAGVYDVGSFLTWQSGDPDGRRTQFLRLNGSTVLDEDNVTPVPTSGEASTRVGIQRFFAATDYVEIQAYQTSGGSRTVGGNFWAHWVCD